MGQEREEVMELAEIDARLLPVKELLLKKEPRMALEKLQFLVSQWDVPKDALWRVYEYYATCYYQMANLRTWRQYAWRCIQATEGQPFRVQQGNFSDYLFMMHYFSDISDREMRELHFLYDSFAQAVHHFPHPLTRHQHKKLRIGYLAGELAENVVSYFSLQLFTAYQPNEFEVYAYSLREIEDQLTDVLREHIQVMRFFPRDMAMSEIAQVIYDDEIDILFDLDVHASGGRTMMVMCYRPAPVQVAGIGYMSTSGTKAIDYFLGDVYCDPPGLHDEDFAEEMIRLPHSHFCYTPSARVLRYQGEPYRPHDPIVFASFNNYLKITDEMLADWLEILRRVPGSHLLVKNSSHKTSLMKVMRRRMLAAGFQPRQFTLEDATGDYLQRYHDVDIMLDTYPYTGGGTTCESLYMGVPVVARYGRRHGERFSYSLLQNAGLGDLACRTREEYIELAVSLAQSPSLLQKLHEDIPRPFQASPVMNSQQYVREVEAAYRRIWQTWLQQKKRK